MKSLILHLHPRTVRSSSLAFNRTIGLGGMALTLFIIQILSGIMLRFYYEPLPAQAYYSIIHIHNDVYFGAFIRNIHHWAGVFLVLVVFLHLLRTFLCGAFYSPRQMNWFIGVILFFLVILSNFSGYLLPWDQLAYWAVTISSGIIAYIPVIGDFLRQVIVRGDEINSHTLAFFYTWHTALLPGLIIILMLFHFWLVRKAGGVLDPDKNSDMLETRPHLVYREWIVMLAVIAVILILAAFFNAPLKEMANPSFSPNPIKAPWYFAGIQELLLHFHPQIGGVLIPLILLGLLFALPLINVDPVPDGSWFFSLKGRRAALATFLIFLLLTIILVFLDSVMPSFFQSLLALPALLSEGLIPLFMVAGIGWVCLHFIYRYYNLNRPEYILIIGISIVTVFIALTLIGNFLRGTDMQLTLFLGGSA